MEILAILILLILGCLFPALLIDAIKAPEDGQNQEKRYRVCACFGGILLLLVLILN